MKNSENVRHNSVRCLRVLSVQYGNFSRRLSDVIRTQHAELVDRNRNKKRRTRESVGNFVICVFQVSQQNYSRAPLERADKCVRLYISSR